MSRTALALRQCWIHELLFSFNVAWIAVWYERIRPQPIWYNYGRQTLYRYWHAISSESETVFEQVIWSVALAATLFLFLRLLAKFHTPGSCFRAIAGATSIAGFPFLALGFPILFSDPLRIKSCALWLLLETVGVLVCGALYFMGRWPLRTAPSMGLLVLHFSLWAWMTGSWADPLLEIHTYGLKSFGIWVSAMFYFGFPVIGFLSSIAWGLYVRSSQILSVRA